MQFPVQKSFKKESKLGQNSNADLTPKRAIWHSWSADWHMASADRYFPSVDWPKFSAKPRDFLIEIKPIFFNFLEIRMCSNSYMISFSIPNSINRRNKSEIEALLSDFSAPLTLKTFWRLLR